jgi:putative ABC transport system permease protein
MAGVLGIFYFWAMPIKKPLWGMARMVSQLLLVGYLLTFIFASDDYFIVMAVLFMMILASSWIALGANPQSSAANRFRLLPAALIATVLGGGSTLIIVTQLVLEIKPWYSPSSLIPMAGMIFASSMNSISLFYERVSAELRHNMPFKTAQKTAFQACMIPNINALFAVGLVSLPGMMTGQILSGVSPTIAVRYQILVMCMLFSAAGLSAFLFLILSKSKLDGEKD